MEFFFYDKDFYKEPEWVCFYGIFDKIGEINIEDDRAETEIFIESIDDNTIFSLIVHHK